MICYIDESGSPVKCSVMGVAAACFESRGEARAANLAVRMLLSNYKPQAVRVRELKWRRVREWVRRDASLIVDEIKVRASAVASVARHVANAATVRVELLGELLACLAGMISGGAKIELVCDHGLLPGTERRAARLARRLARETGLDVSVVRFERSDKSDGVQLADVLAGSCREWLRCDC